MLFFTENEKIEWKEMAEEILAKKSGPDNFNGTVRSNFLPIFQYYAGTLLTAKGHKEEGLKWLQEGTLSEEVGLFSNAFLIGFLKRHRGELVAPEVCFADPEPFIHFTKVPIMKSSRKNFIKQCVDSMPEFKKPFRFMDIGCGNGSLSAALLQKLQEDGKVKDIEEILLIDASPGMIEVAKKTVGEFYPLSKIKTINSKIQDISHKLDKKYDLALSSLAYHHMPLEDKEIHLKQLKPWFSHFVIFELDANNDTPEIFSPEMALSVYQSYGRIIDFVYSCEGSVDLAQRCVDAFLMTECISFLTQPRGVRSDYHMLRSQWRSLFEKVLGKEFTCISDATSYGDEYIDLFTMHYGR